MTRGSVRGDLGVFYQVAGGAAEICCTKKKKKNQHTPTKIPPLHGTEVKEADPECPWPGGGKASATFNERGGHSMGGGGKTRLRGEKLLPLMFRAIEETRATFFVNSISALR